MPLPPPPPGFQLDSAQAPSGIGRPVVRKGVDPVKPDLPEGYTTDPNPKPAVRVPGLGPIDKWERAGPADLEPFGVSGPYLINRKTGDIKPLDVPKGGAAKIDPRDTIAELSNVIGKAFRARELSSKGWFATGFGADAAKHMGGTTAADVDAILDTIGSNTAFERLQKMRDNSPTGGALGAISEKELALLRSTIASQNQGQSDEQFQSHMQDIVNAYGRVLAKIPGGRAEMIKNGWLPKAGGATPPAAKPKAKQGGVTFLGFE